MRVAFRVDASKAIGTGHLKRCLSLADALRSCGAEVQFIWRDHGLDCEPMITAAGFRSLRLPAPPSDWTPGESDPAHSCWAGLSSESDAMDSAAILSRWTPDWIVVDHYGLDARWHDAMRASTGSRIAAIDDLGDRALAPDILIDHNICPDHKTKHNLSMGRSLRLLGGPRYALLQQDYATSDRYQFRDKVRSIGIFMGGTDLLCLSARVYHAVRETGFAGQIQITGTSAMECLHELQSLAASDPCLDLHLDQPDLRHFFARHDLQIGAGGGAMWERCCIGAPSIAIPWADNQREVLALLANAGATLLVMPDNIEGLPEAIYQLLQTPEARKQLNQTASRLVDGHGCARIATAMLPVSVKLATAEDGQMAFAWRNHPTTRLHFRDPSELELDQHLGWWSDSLARSDRRLLVGYAGNRPVGVTRLDIDGDSAEISIYVDPELTGSGIGSRLIDSTCGWAGSVGLGIRSIAAYVKPDNRASLLAFKSAAFEGEGPWLKRDL